MKSFILLFNREKNSVGSREIEPTHATHRAEINAFKKPKRTVPAAEKSSREQSANDEYVIENSDDDDDDDQFSVNETMEQLNKAHSEHKLPSKSRLSISAKQSPSGSGSKTIRNFFPILSTSTSTSPSTSANRASSTESQEKRSRSSLLTSLDEEFNRKCPKIERETTVTQICATDSDATEAISPTENQSPETSDGPNATKPNKSEQHRESEHIESKESSTVPNNRLASKKFVNTMHSMDQDDGEAENKTPEFDPNAAFVDISPDLLTDDDSDDEPMADPQLLGDDNGDDTVLPRSQQSPSKINTRLRNKYRNQKSIEQSPPNSLNVDSEPLSDGGMLTPCQSELNSTNDQENSDLNTEANQLKALNVASDKENGA